MKKGLLLAAMVFVSAIVLSLSVFSPAASKTDAVKTVQNEKSGVVTVADMSKSDVDTTAVLKARFLNMLNHNFVYDTTFDSIEDMVNSSMPALLDFADEENDSFIAENYVADYIFDMYGIEDIDFGGINESFEKRNGYVYIIPRGFTKYSHKITAVTYNEDGSYTVESKVSSSSHDGVDLVNNCTTLFVPNAQSAFGFSIIYSNLGGASAAI